MAPVGYGHINKRTVVFPAAPAGFAVERWGAAQPVCNEDFASARVAVTGGTRFRPPAQTRRGFKRLPSEAIRCIGTPIA